MTTVPRTLLDLAAVVKERELERGINEAEVLRLWDELSLDALLERYPRRAGSCALRAAMARRREGATVTRSELEERFLALIRASPLPSPELNAPIRGYEADFLWRDQRLIVEVDGRAAHATATAFERDRERDRSLAAAGWRTARITWRQLNETPATVLHHLLALVESG